MATVGELGRLPAGKQALRTAISDERKGKINYPTSKELPIHSSLGFSRTREIELIKNIISVCILELFSRSSTRIRTK